MTPAIIEALRTNTFLVEEIVSSGAVLFEVEFCPHLELPPDELQLPFPRVGVFITIPSDSGDSFRLAKFAAIVETCSETNNPMVSLWNLHTHSPEVSGMTLLAEYTGNGFMDARADSETMSHAQKMETLQDFAMFALAAVMQEVPRRFVTATPNPKNKSRRAKGKKPLFEWRTVVIAPKALPNLPKGGTHASPRHHERRGHWSVSKLGKRYWRRATKVGNPANGVVFHDYLVKPPAKGAP